jgi:SAM-dependent methyltransferase
MNDRDLLDASAKIVRDRITPDSYLYPLVQNSAAGDHSGNSAPRRGDLKLPASERLARAVEWGRPQVGDIPPEPPTLRGRVGAVLVKLVRRMLFWYTGQIRTFHGVVAEAAGEQARSLLELSDGLQRQQALLAGTVDRLAGLESRPQQQALEPLRALAERLDEVAASGTDRARELRDKQDALDHALSRQAGWWDEARRHRAWVADRLDRMARDAAASAETEARLREALAQRLDDLHLALAASGESYSELLRQERQRIDTLAARLDQAAEEQVRFAAAGHRRREFMADRLTRIDEAQAALARGVGAELLDMRRQLHEAGAQLVQQQLRLTMLLREARGNSLSDNAGRPGSALAGEMRHLHDPLFADYARMFRGSRADIKERLRLYVPRARQALAAANAPALDLGCGRGEWLELLRDAAIPASGIDTNRDLIRGCREQGLDAREGAVPQILGEFPDRSLSLVTAFHLLEHLPFADMLEAIDQAVRLLKPGGIVIFETPNPKNLLVSTNNFYLDPTHHHPLPSEFLAFVIEARGLCEPEVIPLSPYPDSFHLQGAGPAVEFINRHFFGPQDYGIIARKV